MKKLNHRVTKIKNPTTGEYEGLPAIAGESAYEIAVRLGTFSGTEEEWNNYIKTERDVAVKAIQDRAQQIIDSLPADYTGLTEDVDALKGDLADLEADTNIYSKNDLIDGIEWTYGYFVINTNTNTVQINPLGGFSYGIVDVSNYKDKRKIHATVSSFHSNVSMFLLVNAEGKVVALSGAGVLDKEMNVDDSVTKVYINKYYSNVPSVELVNYVDVKEKLSELNTAFSELDENKLSQSDIAIVTGDNTFSNLELGTLVTGYLTKSGGNGGDYNNDKQTDYISIKPNTYYKWDSYVSDARCAYVLFDENKNVISYRDGNDYAGKVYSITFNSGNAVYAKFGAEAYNTHGLTITELCADTIRGLDNRLRIAESAISDIEDFEPFAMFNKILCVGDSRTAGTYDYPNSQYVVNADYSICNMLAKMTGNTVLNAGSGGATCKTYWENKPTVFSTCENADAVFIWLGVNDIFKGTFDGTVADVSKTTYPNYNDFPDTSCGCLGKIIEFVKEKNPTATIYLCTLDQEFDPASDFRKNEISANALISQIATELGCVLIDLYNDSILKYKSGRNLYWGIEGCHMTTLGYNRVAKIYKNALANNKKKYVGVSVT